MIICTGTSSPVAAEQPELGDDLLHRFPAAAEMAAEERHLPRRDAAGKGKLREHGARDAEQLGGFAFRSSTRPLLEKSYTRPGRAQKAPDSAHGRAAGGPGGAEGEVLRPQEFLGFQELPLDFLNPILSRRVCRPGLGVRERRARLGFPGFFRPMFPCHLVSLFFPLGAGGGKDVQ